MAKSPTTKAPTKKHLARMERERRQNRIIVISAGIILFAIVAIVIFGILDQTILKDLKPVAHVGSTAITSKQFQTRVRYQRYQEIQTLAQYSQMAQYFGGNSQLSSVMAQIQSELQSTTAIGDKVLNLMIEDVLIRNEARKRGITVTAAEIDVKMQELFGYYAKGTPTVTVTAPPYNTPTYSATEFAIVPNTATPTVTPTATGTPEGTPAPTLTLTPTATLLPSATPTVDPKQPTATPTETSTPYTLAGYTKQHDDYLSGLKDLKFADADLRKIVENLLFKEKVTAAMFKDMKPEKTEVWARHILVADEITATAVAERLKKGESFASVAAAVSTDTSNNFNGGDLGWFGKGQMDKAFEKAAFALTTPGQISAPVQSSFGWPIIQLVAKRTLPADGGELKTLKDNALQEWLDNLRTTDKTITKAADWNLVVPLEPTIPASLLATAAPGQ